MPRFQRLDLRRDAEELREKVLEMRRHGDQQRRLLLGLERRGVGATAAVPVEPAASIGVAQWCAGTAASMRSIAGDRIQVGEREAVGEC